MLEGGGGYVAQFIIFQKEMYNRRISDSKTEETYCYQGISWGTAESEVEEKLGISLEQNASAPNYFRAGTLTYSGYTIPCTLL